MQGEAPPRQSDPYTQPVVFHLRVLSPSGRELPWYTRSVVAESGAAEATIPWALNHPTGRYTVVVRDVAGGVTAQQEVSLP